MEPLVIGKVIATITSPEGILALLSGTAVGYIIGILPAVGQGFALILLLPLAFFVRPEIAFIAYASMFGGADLGGSVTSILMNVPGNAGNVATTLDGYPMARAGQAGRAIGLSAGSSIMGSVVGVAVLIAVMPLMRKVMYAFGSREYFLAVVLAMIVAALATGYGRFAKGLVAICLGMFFSFIGNDIVFGRMRFAADITYLTGGIPIVAFIIGLYALSELILLQSEGESIAQVNMARAKLSDTFRGVWEAFRFWSAVAKASIIGVLVGSIPGMGGSVAQYASYGVAKMMARDKSTFGKGEPVGIIACEASNNARDGASMLPTLFLGIPGGPEMAILLGIFLIFGITPGPGMALEHMGLVWTIIICLMLGNVFATALSIFGAPLLSKITTLPITLVTAFTLPLCIASLLSSDSEIWDLATAGILGILGILMKRTGYPVAPVIIGYVLAPLAERSFHTTLQGAYNNPLAFFQSNLALGLVAAIGLAILFPIVFALRAHFSKNRESVDREGYDWGEETAVGTSYAEGLFMSFIFLAVAVIILVRSPQYTLRESGLWPMTVAIVMLIAVLCVLIPEIRRRPTRKRKRTRDAFVAESTRSRSGLAKALSSPGMDLIVYRIEHSYRSPRCKSHQRLCFAVVVRRHESDQVGYLVSYRSYMHFYYFQRDLQDFTLAGSDSNDHSQYHRRG